MDTTGYANWWDGLKSGRVFVSNGPLLRCRANGEWPRHVFKASQGEEDPLVLHSDLLSNGRTNLVPSAEEAWVV